ncbi:UNVERIFIED_CONTAM: hypothetical protein Sradi_0704900 [Sesamum radiatum]|uniref:Uncharacterized protein n=1 Tax=Sesamum radiatum TaxID=300843 RepID=A0AAW2VMH9_SESRA
MTRSRGGELTQFDPEIERSFHRKRNTIERGDTTKNSETEEHLTIIEPTMDHVGAVEKPMIKYSFPAADGTISSIALPTIQANNFEIKPSIIQIIRSSVQFSNLPEEDPNKHLSNFLKICDTLSLIALVMMLLDLGFFHCHYVILLKFSFNLYLLLDRESLYDAWEHFKGMLRRCPHHELPIWRQMLSYAKFLKEVISNKRKWEGGETVKPNEACSAILQNKLPPKFKDPGSFSIPCTIGNTDFDKALCDLGASDMKEEHKEVANFVDTGHEPNKKKRWRNQAYENGGLYKEHTKAWDEFHIKKKVQG